MVKDIVCGMQIDEKKALTASHGGQVFHFCSSACKSKFEQHPEKYTSTAGSTEHGGHRHEQSS